MADIAVDTASVVDMGIAADMVEGTVEAMAVGLTQVMAVGHVGSAAATSVADRLEVDFTVAAAADSMAVVAGTAAADTASTSNPLETNTTAARTLWQPLYFVSKSKIELSLAAVEMLVPLPGALDNLIQFQKLGCPAQLSDDL